MSEQTIKTPVVTLSQALYRYWQVMYLSFYRLRVYVDVVQHWKGMGWLYLLSLLLILSMPLSIRIMLHLDHFLQTQILSVMRAIPSLEIRQGEVFFDKPMPYLIHNHAGQVVAIIDTTGHVTEMLPSPYPALSMLITKHTLYYRTPTYHFFVQQAADTLSPIYQMDLPKTANEIMAGREALSFLQPSLIRVLLMSMIYPAVVGTTFFTYALLCLLMGMVGQVSARLFLQVTLSYTQACRLVHVSATPALTFAFLLLTLRYQFFGAGMVFLLLVCVYFFLGSLAYRQAIRYLAGGLSLR